AAVAAMLLLQIRRGFASPPLETHTITGGTEGGSMIDARKLLMGLLAIGVVLFAALPLLYPLAVAGAACCEQRLSRRNALAAAIAISLAILTGTALSQIGLLPLAGPWRVDG